MMFPDIKGMISLMGNPPLVYIDPTSSLDAIRPASTVPYCVVILNNLPTDQE